VTFKEATKKDPATVGFDRILVKLTGAGEYRDDLTQRWRYLLTVAHDCQSMTGEVAMLKFGESDSSKALKGRALLTRTQ
jgi:hypothetical protein